MTWQASSRDQLQQVKLTNSGHKNDRGPEASIAESGSQDITVQSSNNSVTATQKAAWDWFWEAVLGRVAENKKMEKKAHS